jgi:hypothetical protein
MNAFQILDKNDEAIPINQLDREVCDIMEKEQDPKWYCTLGRESEYKSRIDYVLHAPNWYDTIGWMIANEGKSFQQIIEYYANVVEDFIGKKDENDKIITLEDIYPHQTKLINHWINKGYTTKQIINP